MSAFKFARKGGWLCDALNSYKSRPSLHGTLIATAGWDGTARVWDAETGEELLTLYGHTSVVREVVFSPDGTRLYTISDDGTSRVYLLDLDEFMQIAQQRVTRSLTDSECRTFLHLNHCPTTIQPH